MTTLPVSSLAGPRWARPPHRARPGRRPLPVDIARAGRLLERHWSGRTSAADTITGLAQHLLPGVAVDAAVVTDALVPVLEYLRRESADCRARLDGVCPCEGDAELCEDCWRALGAWWNHQLVHLTSVREVLRAGACDNSTT